MINKFAEGEIQAIDNSMPTMQNVGVGKKLNEIIEDLNKKMEFDVLVKTASGDNHADYLASKLIAGGNIVLTVVDVAGTKTLVASTMGKLGVDSSDILTQGYLNDKLKAGTNITLSLVVDNGVKKVKIDAGGGGGLPAYWFWENLVPSSFVGSGIQRTLLTGTPFTPADNGYYEFIVSFWIVGSPSASSILSMNIGGANPLPILVQTPILWNSGCNTVVIRTYLYGGYPYTAPTVSLQNTGGGQNFVVNYAMLSIKRVS